MRFRTKEKPRGVLRASDQKRLSLLIGGFGLILLCFTIVRRPVFWERLFPDQVAQDAQQVAPAKPATEPVAKLHHDEFLSPSSSDSATAAPSENGLQAEANSDSAVVSVTANKIPVQAEATTSTTSRNGIPRVPETLLRDVKDDVIGVHSTESEAYFAAMKMASRMVEKRSAQAPKGAYALFMDSPDDSRGEAWHIAGRLRRLSEVRGRTNAFGVGTLYDAWITTADSGDQLVHVVAMQAAPELKKFVTGKNAAHTIDFMGPDAPLVEFTGYFFKREAYASRRESGVSLAPLFVAGVLHDIPAVVASSTRAEQLTPYLGWLALFVTVGALLMIWSFAVNDVAHAQTRTHQLTKLPAHMTFDDITAITVGETLQELENTSSTSS